MLGFLIMLLVAAMIGFTGYALAPGALPGGWIGATLAGLLGSAVGGYLFARLSLPMGPQIGGMALAPSLIGAVIVVWLYGLLARQTHRSSG